MRFLIVSGGTGGHIYPGIALGEEFVSRGHEISFVTENSALGKELLGKTKNNILTISAKPLPRSFSVAAMLSPFFALLALWQSFGIIRERKPQAIITTGGYCTLPMIVAGWFSRVPIVLQEQNSSLGLANRIGQFMARKICTSFQKTDLIISRYKVVFTGNPIRRQMFSAKKEDALAKYRFVDGKKSILVFGGSLGARKINEIVLDLVDWFQENDYQVVHVVGNRDFHSFKTAIDFTKYPLYRMLPYEDEMGQALKFADLVISRSGATAISEILALGKPSILIPYPFAADDHQTYNARILEDAGAAVSIPDRELSSGLLRTKIAALFNSKTNLGRMSIAARGIAKPDAAKTIATLAEKLTQ